MSTLKERLTRLKKGSEPAQVKPETPFVRSWERLGTVLQENEQGSFIVRKRTYPYDYAHGSYRLGELLEEARPLSEMCASAGPIQTDRILFLDTETTGLGVGAGNVPFMIGIGYYEATGFTVEQMFIRNPSEEAAMLHELRGKLKERDILVSYNGKCFDWPIIQNRYILNRLRDTGEDPYHLDFLYPSRSLWRNTLPSCRLSSVERERLGLSRIDDVPGSMAPALYFQYLAEGDPTILEGVFEHNEKDILTLACLGIHFAHLLERRLPYEQMGAEELYRLALWLDKLGRGAQAEEAIRLLVSKDPEESADYWLQAASFFKKRGDWGSATFLWERLIERRKTARISPLEPYIELAMYHEHHVKDLSMALHYAEQAMDRLWGRMSAIRQRSTDGGREYEELRKRIDRLKTKLEKKRITKRGSKRLQSLQQTLL